MKMDYPATRRNREPILQELKRLLGGVHVVLEIGSGSGQHAAFFAPAMPHLRWQPSDPEPESRASVDAWCADIENVEAAVELDTSWSDWPLDSADALFSANMIHIAPWEACVGLFAGAGRILGQSGLLVIYGPFSFAGEHVSDSNQAFDSRLKSRNPRWGVRDTSDLDRLAERANLRRRETIAMPANNHILVFERSSLA